MSQSRSKEEQQAQVAAIKTKLEETKKILGKRIKQEADESYFDRDTLMTPVKKVKFAVEDEKIISPSSSGRVLFKLEEIDDLAASLDAASKQFGKEIVDQIVVNKPIEDKRVEDNKFQKNVLIGCGVAGLCAVGGLLLWAYKSSKNSASAAVDLVTSLGNR